jgi:hypothetical protein
VEVHATVDDLRSSLAELADRAAEQARAPGAAVTLRRARARRRWATGSTFALVVAVAAVGITLGRSGLDLPAADRRSDPPWRPLVADAWRATVPAERPLDPVVVAAEDERPGGPWRLTVYRSEYRPAGRPGEIDVCYILEWIASDERQQFWQAHGTCAPEAQTATALAAGGPAGKQGLTAVIGRAPATAARIRLELRGRSAVETEPADTGGRVPGRFYVAFVPRTAYLERMVALDEHGRQVGQAPGQGDLAREIMGFPPTGRVAVVAKDASSAEGALEAVAWPTRYGFCVAVVGERAGGSSSCDSPDSGEPAIAPQVQCGTSGGQGQPTVTMGSVVGGVPRATRTVRVEIAGKRFDVPARDAGEPFDRAFFLTDLPRSKRLTTIRFVAVDAGGATLRTWTSAYKCG